MFSRLSLILIICFLSYSCDDVSKNNISSSMVVSAHKIASNVGIQILKNGGNAFDAAIAVNYTLSVVYPRAGNIGGGGFLLYRLSDGQVGSLDFREVAPNKSFQDMYLDSNKKFIKDLSTIGPLSIGVPGTVAGMDAIHKRFGTMSMKDLMAPSIYYADHGYKINQNQSEKWNEYRDVFLQVNSYNIPFVKDSLWENGDTIKLPEYANTLRKISEKGPKAFYEGDLARLIIKSVGNQGILSINDLSNYKVWWRDVLSFQYHDYTIHSMPPPSSGGIALAQLFKGFDLNYNESINSQSSEYFHLLTELQRRVYSDRSKYLGDPKYFDVPIDLLLDSLYLKSKFKDIDMTYKTSSIDINPGEINFIESHETTHFSIVDSFGNSISMTTTLNSNFGSKLYVKCGGFFLNNQMDDFSSKPGLLNQFGLTGSEANSIAPGKRMLSSMSPTIIEKKKKLYLVLGTPGGSTIITSVFQTAINMIEFNMGLNQAVNTLRTHSQWLPDKLYYEKGIDSIILFELNNMGHELYSWNKIGKICAIHIDNNGNLQGSADENRSFGSVAEY